MQVWVQPLTQFYLSKHSLLYDLYDLTQDILYAELICIV